ncbi:daptide biosynthesis RiPP recognition protein [Streptomyces sp. NRRL S-87]|uniref:daptide biosynthesis RiPP recognition protein n=1 Tax=Streptomyces sp. NRRL S-87 TaxID=1463920 RepID=UPI00068CAD2B|nr:daptide biosynthesis RiPP recognition protein [Streptomyces sp. NRRL S-87]
MSMPTIALRAIEWGTGRPLPGPHRATTPETPATATVVLADAAHLPELLDSPLTGPGSTVLVPGPEAGTATDRSGVTVVTYEGELSAEADAEAGLHPDFYLQTQPYARARALAPLGPVLVRVTGPDDLDAFLADADRARAEGVFPDHITHPAVQLADHRELGAPVEGDGPALRLYVGSDGTVHLNPGGAPLGGLGTPPADLDRAWRTAALDPRITERPWLGRYLAALEAVRAARARGFGGIRVSGFGGRLPAAGTDGAGTAPAADPGGRDAAGVAEGPDVSEVREVPGVPEVREVPGVRTAADAHDPHLPLLLTAGTAPADAPRSLVHDPRTGRAVALAPGSARAAEALLATGDRTAAARCADPAAVAAVADYFAAAGLPLDPEPTTDRTTSEKEPAR